MNWKRFLFAFANLFLLCFPYNIIGCGGEIDPYDYYISFFQNGVSKPGGYQQFYFTEYNFLYENEETVDVARATSEEWIGYTGQKISPDEAYDFVCKYRWDQLSNLYNHLEKNQPLQLPDSVLKNGMTVYFTNSKDLEALGYLMYAKRVEPNVTGEWTDWEPIQRDSISMAGLIKNGNQLYAAAKRDFIKSRYAYQVMRLAHYSRRYSDVLAWHENFLKIKGASPLMKDLCQGLKAGATMRLGKRTQAAYLFSQLFSKSALKRVSNYMSFAWCVNRMDPRARQICLGYCQSPEEKANLLGLFALGNPESELPTLKKIYQYFPSAALLEMLVVRELHKIEKHYLSPSLNKMSGGNLSYYEWSDNSSSADINKWKRVADSVAGFCAKASRSAAIKNPGFYQTAAAYLYFVTRQYAASRQFLDAANKSELSDKLKDQCRLTELLVTVNEKDKIDAAFEQQILPSMQWLDEKAKKSSVIKHDYWEENEWVIFRNNVLKQVLAKRYHAQGEIRKEALCLGDIDFVREHMETKDILKLNALMQSNSKSPFEKWLCANFSMKNDEVIDVIATTHLRDYNFTEAIVWLQKIKDKKQLALQRNPFTALLIDNQENAFPSDEGKFDKLSFAVQMKSLTEKQRTGTATAAELFKLASGVYNMTYYGRAWETVEYYRSGVDGYHIPNNASPFTREYYGAFRAGELYQRAMRAATDGNFRAKCLFMMAKCTQKQIRQPQWDDFRDSTNNTDYDKYNDAEKKYETEFQNNKFFPQLIKEYGGTAFYKEAYSTCSYLRDFVKRHPSK